MSKSFEEWWSTYKWNYLEECKEHTERSWDAAQKAMVDEVILKLAEIANSANHMTTPVGMTIDYITELRQKYVVEQQLIKDND